MKQRDTFSSNAGFVLAFVYVLGMTGLMGESSSGWPL